MDHNKELPIGPNLVYKYSDGTLSDYYYKDEIPRELRRGEERPVKMYTSRENTRMISMILDPSLDTHPHQLYFPLDEYVLKNGELIELQKHRFTDEVYYHLDDINTVKYEQTIDGEILTKADALIKYPEYFI